MSKVMSKVYEQLAKKETQLLSVINNQLDENMGDLYRDGKTEETEKTLQKVVDIANEMINICKNSKRK